MNDASALYQTILLVEVEVPAAAVDSVPVDKQDSGLSEALAFIQAVVLECGMCRESRTIGTELVAVFTSAAAALGAACSVQQACAGHSNAVAPVHVRILLDRQPDQRTGDPQRTEANWRSDQAERLLQQLPAGRIFATSAVAERLSQRSLAGFQLYEHGNWDVGELHQVVCHEDTITRIAVPTRHRDRITGSHNLCLRWRGAVVTLTPESPSLTMGRSDRCDIRIESELASRIHARLGFHETNFLLADQSTNGTFVQIEDDEEVCLHHEQIVLRGSGVISLGRRILGGRGKLIYFSLTH